MNTPVALLIGILCLTLSLAVASPVVAEQGVLIGQYTAFFVYDSMRFCELMEGKEEVRDGDDLRVAADFQIDTRANDQHQFRKWDEFRWDETARVWRNPARRTMSRSLLTSFGVNAACGVMAS